MNHYTFFLNVEYQLTTNGFSGTFTANKIYSVEDYETVDVLIDDCMNVLKKFHGSVTFQAFHDGTDEKSLARLLMQPYENDDSKKLMIVKWPTNRSADIIECALTRQTVKSEILDAVRVFRYMNSQK